MLLGLVLGFCSHSYLDSVNLTPDKLPFAKSTMTHLTVKLLNAEEIEQRRKVKLAKRKFGMVGIGSSSFKDPGAIRVNYSVVLKGLRSRKEEREGFKTRQFATLLDIHKEDVVPSFDLAAADDLAIFDIHHAKDKDKGVETRLYKILLSIPKTLPIKDNVTSNS